MYETVEEFATKNLEFVSHFSQILKEDLWMVDTDLRMARVAIHFIDTCWCDRKQMIVSLAYKLPKMLSYKWHLSTVHLSCKMLKVV